MIKKTLILFSLLTSLTYAEDLAEKKNEVTLSDKKTQEADILKLSEAFGHLLGKNLGEMGVALDVESIIKGLRDSSSGVSAPMNENECIEAITSHQKKAFEETSVKNLKEAEDFLTKNSKTKGFVSLENGKVLYKTLKSGKGLAVKSSNAPLVRYVGKYLNGSVFGSSKEDELLSLEDIIPGLRAAIVGMREGEKRVIHIHPDLAYGTRGYLSPNSLLTFEIEVVKANVESEKESLADKKQTAEPALPLEEQKNIR